MKLKGNNVFYGWWVVGAVFIISAYVSGIVSFGFTAVVEPIASEFGWSYASISLAGSIRGLEIGLLAPLAGLFVDRLGPRKLLFFGGLLTGAGLLLLSRVSSLPLFYGTYMLIAVGISTSIGVVPITVVGNWFRRRLSLVIGIVVSGVAMGGFFVPLVSQAIDVLGWRTAMAVFGMGAWGIIIPLSMIVHQKPEAVGCLPDGDLSRYMRGKPDASRTVTPQTNANVDITVREAVACRFFWHIEIALICHVFAIHAVATHVMPYLSSIGINRLQASLVASALPVLSIIGRLSFGWLGDRWDKRRVTAAGICLIVASLLMFGFIDRIGTWSIPLFVVLFSIGYGGPVPLMPTLLREKFGRTHIGAILGLSQGLAMIGSISGQPLAGWVFDVSGSYIWAWFLFALANTAGIISMLTAPRMHHEV